MNGFINLNKPVGISSAQVVGRVKRILNLPKNVKRALMKSFIINEEKLYMMF